MYSRKGSTNHRPTIAASSSRFLSIKISILKFVFVIVCYAVGFSYVCSTAMFYTKKSRVIKFWGFFMYLLFLGIVQTNTMKLDNALHQAGKLCFGEKKIEWQDRRFFSPSFLPRAFIWNGVTDFQNSLQVQQFKIPNWNCFILSSFYRAKSWYTV